jgi:small GTP-binding protein
MKVVLIGDTQVGKTCLLGRITTNGFKSMSPPTVGAAFQTVTISTAAGAVNLQIWDTAGQEKYRALTPMYYRSAQVAILVFDVTNFTSYSGLQQWFSDLEQKTEVVMRIFLVGNKCDLADDRKVSSVDAQRLAEQNGAVAYCETSAKTGTGVASLFRRVAEESARLRAKLLGQDTGDIARRAEQSDEKNCC